jgi:hypothetical protein
LPHSHRIAIWAALTYLTLCAGIGFIASEAYASEMVVDGSFRRLGNQPGESAWIIPAVGGVESGVGRVSEGTSDTQGYAAFLALTSDYAAELVQPLLSLVPGREYILTAWVRTEKSGVQASIGIRTQQGYTRLYRGLSTDGWERIELRFTAAEGWAQIVLSNTTGTDVYWDDISLQEYQTVAEMVAAQWDAQLKLGKPLYTGLVVNAIGTGLERGMSPKIYDIKGKLIFSGVGASFDQLIRKGLVAYVHTLEEATAHPRLAVSDAYPLRLPLVVEAQGVSGMPRTGVIIGAEDARKLRAATNQYDFLGRYAIVFVVD